MNRKSFLWGFLGLLGLAPLSGAESQQQVISPLSKPAGFRETREIGFDPSITDRKPTILKNWRLVGVSSGLKANYNHLWFQDPDNNVYLLRGITVGDPSSLDSAFVLDTVVEKLVAR